MKPDGLFRASQPIIVLLAIASTAAAADWVRFRGPNGSGISDAVGLPGKWSDKENVLWKTDLPGHGSSSPIVFSNRIYVTSFSGYGVGQDDIGKPQDLVRHLGSYELSTGKKVWDVAVKSEGAEEQFDGFLTDHGYASNTPTIDTERVYAMFGRSGVRAYDHQGKELWKFQLGSDGSFRSWGSATSLVVIDNLLIVNADAENDCLIALDKTTGKEIWRTEAKGYKGSWSTPIVVDLPGGRKELVVCMPGEIWGLNPKDGGLQWYCETQMSAPTNTSAVTDNGVIYVVLGSPGSFAAMAVKAGGTDDVSATHVLWRKQVGSYVPSAVVSGGHLYWVNNQGIAFCLKGDTGEEVYRERLSNAGTIYASAVLADGKLFAVTRRNGTFVLKAGPKFEQLALNKLSDKSDFNASPAVPSGRLLLRSNTSLYCIGTK
ncbi:MAG: serine/threonine protein kinase [Planctomycetes bacterium]|nr:serine/threonine protein kinase [Planctomycetota bacterium]